MVNPKFSAALDVLVKAKADIAELLNDADTGSVSIAITSNLDKAIGRLSFMTGTNISAASADPFPPVTNFMGEELEIKVPEEVVIDPTEEERKTFLAKVDNLTTSLLDGTLTPQEIVNNSPLPEDHTVIRGAAKRVGLEDYENAAITSEFVARIQDVLIEQAASDARQAEIDSQLQGGLTSIETVSSDAVTDMSEEALEQEAAATQTKKGKGK